MVARVAPRGARVLARKKQVLTALPEVLIFVDWYLPGYRAGGPIQSVASLVTHLPCRFSIVTSCFDHATSTPYPGIATDQWIERAPNERVIYLSKRPSVKQLSSILAERAYHRILINSLFSVSFAVLPLFACRRMGMQTKVILAPRGMLKPGALSLKSGKKKTFIALAKTFGWFRGITWLASSSDERNEIVTHFGQASTVVVAPNLPRKVTIRRSRPKKEAGKLHLYTVARVSQEKNLLQGIEWLAQTDGCIRYDIFGTLQNTDYLAKCQAAAERAAQLDVRFHGDIAPHEIPGKTSQHHFMFLPTLGENYGHSIAEAIGSGIPVIVSDQTPWRNLHSDQLGWDLPLAADRMLPVLLHCLEMDDDLYTELCQGTETNGPKRTHNEAALRANLKLFCETP